MSHKKTHDIRVEGFHIDVSDGTAGERPHFGFMLECRSDLQNKTKEPAVLCQFYFEMTSNCNSVHF